METTTTSCACAKWLPSKPGELPAPTANAPPCSHTSTGRFLPSNAGV